MKMQFNVNCIYIFSPQPIVPVHNRDAQLFQKSRGHLKTLGASRMT